MWPPTQHSPQSADTAGLTGLGGSLCAELGRLHLHRERGPAGGSWQPVCLPTCSHSSLPSLIQAPCGVMAASRLDGKATLSPQAVLNSCSGGERRVVVMAGWTLSQQ